MVEIFTQIVLPVFLVFVFGYLVQKWKPVDLKSISTLVIYILNPCLVFRTFYTAELNLQYLLMAVFAVLLFFILVAINKLYVKLRRHSASTESGLVLGIGFMNSGNYGAPLLLFAYGENAFAYAVSLMVLHSIMMNFLGGFYANRDKGGVRAALQAVLRLPPIYACLLALLFQFTGLRLPDNLFASVDLVAMATIPVVMLVLGIQIAQIRLKVFDWEKMIYGTTVRLILSPLVAFALCQFMPFDPLLQKVLIVSSAMPTAVMAIVYAIQFDTEPDLVSGITLISTLASLLTLTILLVILG